MPIVFVNENQSLNGNSYQLPKDLKQYLSLAHTSLAQNKDSKTYKRITHLVNPTYNDRSRAHDKKKDAGVPYGSVKKIDFLLRHNAPNSFEFAMLGGDRMRTWARDTLNRERTKVKPVAPTAKAPKVEKPSVDKTKPIKCGSAQLTVKESVNYGNNPYIDYLEEYSPYNIFNMFITGDKPWVNRINPSMYKQALSEFTHYGHFIKFPEKYVYQWMGIIMQGTAILRAVTDIAGHSQWFPMDDFLDAFFYDEEEGGGSVDKWEEYKESIGEDDDYYAAIEFLDDKNFFNFFQLPDGSDPWSDFGIKPLEDIINEYDESMPAEKVLVLVNKAMDVVHCRGDLSSMFIVGGSKVLSQISENKGFKTIWLSESQLKTLKNLFIKN